MGNLLDVKNLRVEFNTEHGLSRAVEDGCLSVRKGETMGLVGESGCGKTVTALSILRLLPSGQGKITSGEIMFDGRNILDFSDNEMRALRGGSISMIFQEPVAALNPLYTIGSQIEEAMRIHLSVDKKAMRKRIVELLESVEMPSPAQQIDNYPHQLSGGMNQRAMIAMALACDPELLIADEPTTALDVTIQAQILDLFSKLKKKSGISILLITHDLAVVGEVADRVTVMYAGITVEVCEKDELFSNPLHPYTQGLLKAVPLFEPIQKRRLSVIPGKVPDPMERSSGCPFNPRCEKADDYCRANMPLLVENQPEHRVRCWKVK
ncbi:MAG: ABC transporter ATP-binding protein [bacterium]